MTRALQKAPTAREKQHGIVYTPEALANAVAERLAAFAVAKKDEPIVVTDPACGDGSLLEAFARAAGKLGIDVRLQGFDLDNAAIAVAKKRLQQWPDSELFQRDFLNGRTRMQDLFSSPEPKSRTDVFIANPPYVRTQLLGSEQARDLAKRFDIGGRVDLAYAFCMAMIDALPAGGHFGFIVSNKFMTIKAGATLRKYFQEHTELLEIWDLGDTKLFSAAVLPAVVFGRRASRVEQKNVPFKSMYTSTLGAPSTVTVHDDVELLDAFLNTESASVTYNLERLEIRRGILQIKAREHLWLLQDAAVEGVQHHMRNSRSRQYSDVFRTKVGVKTTADHIFIRNDWVDSPTGIPVEKELLWPIRMTSDAQKWIATSPEAQRLSVLYPYQRGEQKRRVINLDDYPGARAYLEAHRSTLEGRKYVIESGRQWFEPWVPHQPWMWYEPRAVFPEIADRAVLAFDHPGVIPNGTLFWMHVVPAAEHELLRAGVAIANTAFAVEYYDLMMATKLYAGRRRWNSQHVGSLPFPGRDKDVALLAFLCNEAIAAAEAGDTTTLGKVEFEIDKACRKLFGGGVL